MYYRLKDTFLLRGWENSKCGLVDITTGTTVFPNAGDHFLLRLCNGIVQMDSLLFNDAMRQRAEQFAKAGFLDASDTPLSPISENQKYQLYDNRYISSIHWSITGRCNYNCRHCYMGAPHGNFHEFTLKESKKIIDDMVSCGIRKVSLTGGEALVHPDFWNIVDYLLENGIFPESIYSNGFLINETFFENCKKRNIQPQISLSFDGLNGGHEWLRNVPGALGHVTRALDLCREHGFHTDVEYCMYQKNKEDLFDSIAFLEEHGCSSIKINTLVLDGEANAIKDQAISMEEKFELLPEILKKYKERPFQMRMALFGVMVQGGKCLEERCKKLDDETAKKCHLCEHAHFNIYISPEGKILPCIPIDENPGLKSLFPNILEMPLKQILKDSYFSKALSYGLEDYYQANPECSCCEHRYRCGGGCRGLAVGSALSSNYLAKDQDTCYYHKNHIYDQVHALFTD